MKQIAATFNDADQTISVTYYGETRTFPAYKNGKWASAGAVFSGRFRTGTKLWPVGVTVFLDTGNAQLNTAGRSNRGGVTNVVGWWTSDSGYNTRANGIM